MQRKFDGREAELAAAYRDGATIRDLAARYGCALDTVAKALDRAGVERRPNHRPAKLIDHAADVVVAYEAGESLTTLAERYGVAVKSVHGLLKREGVRMRPTGRPNPLRGREAAVAADYQAGATLRGLMVKYGATDRTVRAAIVGQDVPIRRRGPFGSR